MQGYEALWLPGTDHASIATEAKIVEKMREEGITKEDIRKRKILRQSLGSGKNSTAVVLFHSLRR